MPGSREDLRPGQQLYGAIEFVRNPEHLFGKIDSGRYDWLGVRPDGQFVVGSPPVSRVRATASATVTSPGSSPRNRVDVHVPLSRSPSSHEYASADEARREFTEVVDRLQTTGDGSGLYRVVLYLEGARAQDEFVVRALRNVL